jgi:hypothetical protein
MWLGRDVIRGRVRMRINELVNIGPTGGGSPLYPLQILNCAPGHRVHMVVPPCPSRRCRDYPSRVASSAATPNLDRRPPKANQLMQLRRLIQLLRRHAPLRERPVLRWGAYGATCGGDSLSRNSFQPLVWAMAATAATAASEYPFLVSHGA